MAFCFLPPQFDDRVGYLEHYYCTLMNQELDIIVAISFIQMNIKFSLALNVIKFWMLLNSSIYFEFFELS